MRKTAFQQFASKYVIRQMPGFAVQGNLVYQLPVGLVLRAFLFDSSSHDPQSFNPNAFVQPLFIPTDHVVMNLGERLPGVWKLRGIDDPILGARLIESMKEHGIPLFDALGAPEKLAANSEGTVGSKDYYRKQARAYSLVLIGETQKAIKVLDELLIMLKEVSSFQKWALNVYGEVADLRNALLRDPSEARALLARWSNETRGKLKLPS